MSNNAAMNNFILKSFCKPICQTTIEYLLCAIHWSEQCMAKQKLIGDGSCIKGAPDLLRETDHNKQEWYIIWPVKKGNVRVEFRDRDHESNRRRQNSLLEGLHI